ncbi:MAG TPA: ubiquinone/menaquinone biosynthesis methyltransferase [Candidatus Binataceae bacterium]|nr:ubiquinone/menaquinone biosynthesis methyltransferase [Candidatus Binataceae bacterium]
MSQAPRKKPALFEAPGEKAEWVRRMFARIAPAYDRVNSVMTFGMDRRWRRATVAAVAPAGELALDVATGTGELAIELVRQGARTVVGVDFVIEMIAAGREKATRTGSASRIGFAAGDALALPFDDNTFGALVNGFLLRNLADLPGSLREFHRVLKPGGRIACLDVTHPPGVLRPLSLAYFNRIVPLIGGTLSGDFAAYRYLPRSLGELPEAGRLARMMAEAGFSAVGYQRLNFGLIAIHTGRK